MNEKIIKSIKTSKDVIDYIKASTFSSVDIVYKELFIHNETIYVVYNESTADENLISDYVVRSIKRAVEEKVLQDKDKNVNESKNVENGSKKTLLDKIINNKLLNKKNDLKKEITNMLNNIDKHITMSKTKKIDLTQDDIFYFLFSGFTLVIYDGDIFSIGTRRNLDRTISVPTSENTVKGPKDAFNESYQINIGLIRKRIKTENLVLEEEIVGRRSKTKIGIVYIQDIAKNKLIKYVKEKLKNIDIDAIIDSNYIVELIEDSTKSNFPTMITSERPDLISFYLLQGRVALVVENTPFVIVIPAFLNDFVNNIEDYYQKNVNVFFTKLIRYAAFFVTIMTPAIYVALITFDQESIPTQLLLSFTTQREGVPFPAYIEAFIMIFAFEILREGDYRVPNNAGSTLSIVGALILGEAAVSAGIVSPIMIIVIAITTISGLMFNDISMTNALRTWRMIFLIFASIAGLVGIGIATCLLIIKLASTTSAHMPYTYPIAPANMDSIKKGIIRRTSILSDTKRQKILTDNLTKLNTKKEQV